MYLLEILEKLVRDAKEKILIETRKYEKFTIS